MTLRTGRERSGLGGWRLAELRGRSSRGRRDTGLFFLQHQRDVLADRGSELFRNQGEKPGQSHFQPHVVIGKIHKPGCALAEHADLENKAIAAPGFLANSEDTEVMRPGRLQAGFYT